MKNQNSEILRSIRQRYNMTQKEFAEELHVSLRTLQGWESRSCPDYVLSLIQQLDNYRQLLWESLS